MKQLNKNAKKKRYIKNVFTDARVKRNVDNKMGEKHASDKNYSNYTVV
jgi:hypothetical protein